MSSHYALVWEFELEVFDGCDQTWMHDDELAAHMVPWLKGALKERGLRILGKNKRDMVEALLEWEDNRRAQIMLWGNPRYCQVGVKHDPHPHQAMRYEKGLAVDNRYECDGRAVRELSV